MRTLWSMLLLKILLCAVISGVANQSMQEPEAKAVMGRKVIRIGEQVKIKLELSFPVTTKSVLMPELKDTVSEFVEVIEVSDIDTSFDEVDVGTKIYTQIITVTSWDSGYHVIPPFKFRLDGDSIKTQPLLLQVNSVTVMPDKDIKDIKPIKEVPFSLLDWLLAHRWLIISILLLIIMIILGFYLYKRYIKGRQLEEIKIVPKEAADALALRKLRDLKERKLWQSNKIKEYYAALSYIIREYIENRFEFNALEQTTDEIQILLKPKMEENPKQQEVIHQLLFNADMAKYAKQEPLASENEEAMKQAIDFVEKTAYKEELIEDQEREEKKEMVKSQDNV